MDIKKDVKLEEILARLKERFPPFRRSVLLQLYRVRMERLRMLMIKGVPEDVRLTIEGKVRNEEKPPIFHLPGTGTSTFAKTRRAKRLASKCYKCARWTCEGNCRRIGLPSTNRYDKIGFIQNGLSKENLDDIQISLETHPSGDVREAILDLWPQFQKEWQRIGRLKSQDLVCQLVKEWEGKNTLNS